LGKLAEFTVDSQEKRNCIILYYFIILLLHTVNTEIINNDARFSLCLLPLSVASRAAKTQKLKKEEKRRKKKKEKRKKK
jgi:hypothetical protein